MEEVGNNALLFRTKEAMKFLFVYEGTYFAYDKDFSKGMVRYGGKDYYDLLLNLDAHSDDLNLKANGYLVESVTLPKQLVDYFIIGNKKFVNIKTDNPVMQPGYYETIYSSDANKLYKKNIKKLTEEMVIEGRQTRLVRKFESTNRYFLVNDEGTFLIKNKRMLISHFPRQRREIRKEIDSFIIFRSSDYLMEELEFQEILKTIDNN